MLVQASPSVLWSKKDPQALGFLGSDSSQTQSISPHSRRDSLSILPVFPKSLPSHSLHMRAGDHSLLEAADVSHPAGFRDLSS